VGWEKVACWSTKVSISLKCIKTEEKLLWRDYRNSPTLFRTVPSPTPYDLLFPKTSIAIISGMGKATDFKFDVHLQGPSKQKPTKNLGEKGAWAYPEAAQSF